MKKEIKIKQIHDWIIWIQCILFFVLYAIWSLPETILIRNICLILGCLLSIKIIFHYRNLLTLKKSIPIWLMFLLFVWVTCHLFIFSNNFLIQYSEYTSIWKRSALGFIFSMGFGIALGNNHINNKNQKLIWITFFLGLLMPVIIYYIKYLITYHDVGNNLKISDAWKLHYESLPFYIPKTSYICFCTPIVAVALANLSYNLRERNFFNTENLILIITISITIFLFYNEKIKNGLIISILLISIFLLKIIFIKQNNIFKKIVTIGLIIILALIIVHKQNNKLYYSIIADTKIALNTNKYTDWKINAENGLPYNEFGNTVNGSYYLRIAWAKSGLELVLENPIGYGLIERSFGYLAKIKWPESKLHQSHSGWIDLTLGLGIIGLLLILSMFLFILLNIHNLKKNSDIGKKRYLSSLQWILFSLLVMWSLSEISQKVYFDSLIFWLGIASGYVLKKNS